MFRVQVESDCSDPLSGPRGAWRSDSDLAVALFHAVKGSGTVSSKSMMLGMIAVAIMEETFDEPEEALLRKILEETILPSNVMGLVKLALDD